VNKRITLIIYIVLALILSAEFIYFGNKYYNFKKNIDSKKENIKKYNQEISVLKNKIEKGATILSPDEEQEIMRELTRKDIKSTIGACVNNTIVRKKAIDKSKSKIVRYFDVELRYEAKDEYAARKLIALLMLNKNVYKITDITSSSIRLIYKKEGE